MDKKWNLQDIRPTEPRKSRAMRTEDELMQQPPKRQVTEEDDGTVEITIENGTHKKRRHIIISLVVFFVILGIGFLISFLTAGADISVFPKHREPNINATLTAYRTPQVAELSYEIMTLEADGERQVTATGQEEVQEQATGMITIYNNTDSTERLIKNTRFESPNGLIYKITESVDVPAAVGEQPGSIQAKVFADGPGEQYNIAPTRFTIPGYAENGFDELFENIYAENTETFVGGFNGLKFIIDDTELETARQQLQTELRDALLDRVPNEKPAGFVVFDDAISITFESLPAVEYGENLVTIKEQALLQIPIFKKEEFAAYIAAATVPGYEDRPVRIDNIDTLDFSYTIATTSSTNIGNLDEIEFDLQGRPQIVWTFDEGKLKTDLLGVQKTALPSILGAYPAIEKAEAVVRPFWKQSFPEEMDAITITEMIEAEQ